MFATADKQVTGQGSQTAFAFSNALQTQVARMGEYRARNQPQPQPTADLGPEIAQGEKNEEIFVRYMNDEPFQDVVSRWMASEAYRRLREDQGGGRPPGDGSQGHG